MADPNVCGAGSPVAPSYAELELIPEPAESFVCVEPRPAGSSSSGSAPGDSSGAGGAGGAGADALVERFSEGGGQGTSGAPEVAPPGASPAGEPEDPCIDEILRATAACTKALQAVKEEEVSKTFIEGLACAGSVLAMIECFEKGATDRIR